MLTQHVISVNPHFGIESGLLSPVVVYCLFSREGTPIVYEEAKTANA